MGTEFVPGEWWTRERAAAAVKRMADAMASPEMQAMMQAISEAGDDPAAAAAMMSTALQRTHVAAPGIDPAACTYRRGRPGDEARFAELIIHGELPPFFISEFIEGFVAAEHDGTVIGCGGLEMYDDCGVIRSVVVDENARNKRIGERMAELLMDDARAAGATDVYLFTMHAVRFWQRLGFEEAPIATWKQPPRISWQYQFVEQHPQAATGIIPMWRRA